MPFEESLRASMGRSPLRLGSSPLERQASMTATRGSQRPMLARRSLSLGAVRYTLNVMPAVADIWAMRERPSRSLVEAISCLKSDTSCVSRPKQALCGSDMVQRSGDYAGASNFLIATAVPACSRLRPSLRPPIWRLKLRLASGTPRGFCLPRTPIYRADRQGVPSILRAPSVLATVGERFRVPRCLAGGFAQLGSI